MSPSPETDGRGAVGPDVPAPWHGGGGEAAGRGAGRPLPAPGTLGHSGRPRRPSGTDGLLQRPGGVGGGQASPASVRGGLADLWDSLWFLLMAAVDGFSPLENEWDRQDQLRWFSRDDPHSNSRSFSSERWNSICAGNGRNGSLPTSPLLRSTSHTCRTSWGRTSARRHWTSWGTVGSEHSRQHWSTRVSGRGASQ